MLRLYQYISEGISSFMKVHEKEVFTIGARLLAAACVVTAVIMAQRCSSQLF